MWTAQAICPLRSSSLTNILVNRRQGICKGTVEWAGGGATIVGLETSVGLPVRAIYCVMQFSVWSPAELRKQQGLRVEMVTQVVTGLPTCTGLGLFPKMREIVQYIKNSAQKHCAHSFVCDSPKRRNSGLEIDFPLVQCSCGARHSVDLWGTNYKQEGRGFNSL